MKITLVHRAILGSIIISWSMLAAGVFAAEGPPANSELAVDETFDQPLAKPWSVNTGDWKTVDGVLVGKEIAADKHAAAARRVIETGNAVYQMRFQMSEQCKAFHFGFDPAKGELKKRGHLFSVIVMPDGWKILKHVDKDQPKEDPNEVLVSSKTAIKSGQWHKLRVTTWEQFVTVKVDDEELPRASHPTFGVKKPTLVFRCVGDGVQIDDLKVWKQVQ